MRKYSIKDFLISKQEIKKSDTINEANHTQGVPAIG
jgi:phage host-nuclease inhibitor protein Gam